MEAAVDKLEQEITTIQGNLPNHGGSDQEGRDMGAPSAVDFYTALYREEDCDSERPAELLRDLLQLGEAEPIALDSPITLLELTTAVSQLASGKASGIDGLPADVL